MAATVSLHDDGRAALVASELVTNAVVHSQSPLQFGVRTDPDWLCIEVTDADGNIPVKQPSSPEGVSGRGLALVEALAEDWGVAPQPGGGKTVWARIHR